MKSERKKRLTAGVSGGMEDMKEREKGEKACRG